MLFRSRVAQLFHAQGQAAAISSTLSEETVLRYRRQFVPSIPRQNPGLPPEDQILLIARRIETAGGKIVQMARTEMQPTQRGTRLYIVQFSEAITDATRALLQRIGAVEHGYVPNQALLLELTPAQSESLVQAEAVKAVVEVDAQDKVQPFLANLATRETGSVRAVIEPLCAADSRAIAAAVSAAGGTIEAADRLIRAVVPLSAGQTLLADRKSVV